MVLFLKINISSVDVPFYPFSVNGCDALVSCFASGSNALITREKSARESNFNNVMAPFPL